MYAMLNESFSCPQVTANSTAIFTAGFDNVGTSMLTDFQCLTLTSWAYIMYRTVAATSPFAIMYFVTLVIFGAYFVVGAGWCIEHELG